MNHFPVTASVLSAVALEPFIATQYKLVGVRCKLLKTFVNDTYFVEAGSNQFVFRVYTKGWRSELEIREEIRMICAVADAGISVSTPILDSSDDYIQKFMAPEGDRYGVLFSIAPGKKVFNTTELEQRNLGEYLAKLHQATQGMKLHRVDYDGVTMLVYAFEKFESYLKRNAEDELFMLKTKQYLLEEFRKIKFDEVRKGGVHMDFWADNLHIDSAGRITLFDFDFCGNGIQVLDIAFYLTLLQGLESNETTFVKKNNAFLAGYESITKLTEEERGIILILGAAICFFYMGVQRDRFATVFFNEDHLGRMINIRLKRWMSFHKMI